MGGGTQHRVAEVAGRKRSQIAVALGADALRRFVEHEQLVLEAGLGGTTERLGSRQHAAQYRAGANGVVAAVGGGELADEIGRAVFQGAFTGYQQSVAGVREAAVPASDRVAPERPRTLVELVVHVPAEHAVAKAAAVLQQARELLQAHELAAQHAVCVCQAQHHLAHAALSVLADFGVYVAVHVSTFQLTACG